MIRSLATIAVTTMALGVLFEVPATAQESPSATPSPTVSEAPSPSPAPSEAPTPSDTPSQTPPPSPSQTPPPSPSPTPSKTHDPSQAPNPTRSPPKTLSGITPPRRSTPTTTSPVAGDVRHALNPAFILSPSPSERSPSPSTIQSPGEANMQPGPVAGNDPIPQVAPQVVAYTNTHLFDAALIFVIIVFGSIDFVLFALNRRGAGPS